MTINQEVLNNAVEISLVDSVLVLQKAIIDITPRDTKRMPKDPSRKGTGNLKRSIGHDAVSRFEYKIGTMQGEAEYWKYLEYGTPNMQARSFLRKGIIDNMQKVLNNFSKRLKQLLQ